jgi:drug/metabolite transporter superfamily protein YnfA
VACRPYAASTLRASVRFAAALCEIGGSFLIFTPILCVRNHTQRIERFAGHHEAREALVLSIAGVTTIMLIESLILLILY